MIRCYRRLVGEVVSPGLLEQEQRLFAEFRRRSAAYLDATNRDDWDMLAIAQHHGTATRLLDWTDNPLVALWFAVREGTQQSDSVVWCFPFRRDAPQRSVACRREETHRASAVRSRLRATD
jgi:hypothetical protein